MVQRSHDGVVGIPAPSEQACRAAATGRPRLAAAVIGMTLMMASAGCAPGSAGLAAELDGTAERIDPGPSHVEAEIGGMDEFATNEAFNALAPDFARCVERGSAELDTFGGHAHIALRVKRDGQIRWAYLKDSTLGDRETERCVLGLVRQTTWPRPLSGEGLADSTFDVEPRKEPSLVDARRVGRGVLRARNQASQCRHGVPGTFRATVYLGKDGRVLSAGVAPPSEAGETVADCVAESLEGLPFGYTSARGAKTSFEL